MRQSKARSIGVVPGDTLNLADSGVDAKTKLCLAQAINSALRDRGLKQKDAARLLRIKQPKISALVNYRLTGFSLERLLNFLNDLGWDVEIVIKHASEKNNPEIRVGNLASRLRSVSKGARE